MTVLFNRAGILFAGVDGKIWHVCGALTQQKLEWLIRHTNFKKYN